MTLILASSSPRRRELLTQTGLTFTVIKPDIDESQQPDEYPIAYVRRLSLEKAQAVAHMIDQAGVIIAADTTVFFDGQILGKPADADEARAMLMQLRGKAHIVCTGFTVMDSATGTAITRDVSTYVMMREYSDDEIAAYIATGDPFDKAGGYAIQHVGFHPVDRIEGSHTNVIGFPVDEILAILHTFKFTNSS